MRLQEAATPVFGRHETFHPRYGWFRKAYTCTDDDANIFNDDDATVKIGVGKNMVRSIRFWGLAAKLIVENNLDSVTKRSGLTTTEIGKSLFGDSGWDQYLEFPGTLWLMHWLLLSPQSRLPVWWIAFNEFNAVEFTDTELELVVAKHLNQNIEWRYPSASTIKKDISTLLRTYAPVHRTKTSGLEEMLDCPLRELRLIDYSKRSSKYRFAYDEKPTLPAEILIFSILNFIAYQKDEAGTIGVSRLASEPGAPGRVFKLSEYQIIEKLEAVIHQIPSLELTSSAGITQFVWVSPPGEVANQILDRYYRTLHI